MSGITAIDVAIFVLVAAALIGGGDILRRIHIYNPDRRGGTGRSRRIRGRHRPQPGRYPASTAFDPAEQLRCVMEADYRPQRLLSYKEAQVFFAAERAVKQAGLPWRVMAQVNLGEILTCKDPRAFSAVNSKRVAMLVITNGGMPLAAIEYQGRGHHQESAATRDAVKKEALRRAGIEYIEVKEGDRSSQLNWQIARLADEVDDGRRATG